MMDQKSSDSGDLIATRTQNGDNNNPQILPNDDELHYEFATTIMDTKVMYDVIRYGKSLVIYIGIDSSAFSDLSIAIETPYDRQRGPTSTKLMGNFDNTLSTSLASKVAAKLHKPIYISYNAPTHDFRMTEQIERCLFHVMSVRPEKF